MTIKRIFNLLLIVLSLCTIVYSQSMTFGRLTNSNGLSNNTVYDVLQDQTGFIWFATDDGLNRFDGYEFKVFWHNPDNENSLADNSVWAIMEDSKGKIWIGTKSGWLNCYDPVTDKFKKWKLKSDITEENSINCILEDSKKKIWIGTYRGGLYRFDPATGKSENWFNRPEDDKSLSNNFVSSIFEDNLGNIWVSTYNGLNVLNPPYLQSEFVRIFNHPENASSISGNLIWDISRGVSDTNLIWIGTANGLTSYKTDTKIFSQIQIQNPNNLQFGNSASSVIEDKVNNDKILWIDSYAGLIRFDINNGKISRFISDQNNPNSLLSNQINAIIKDRSNVLWIATNEGVNYFSTKTAYFNNSLNEHYNYLNDSKLYKKNIRAISKTSDGRLWFGTDQGLFYTLHTNNSISIQKLPGSDKINVWSLTPGGLNDLWIGTYGQGLFKLDTKSYGLKEIQINDKSIRSQAVNFDKYVYSDYNNNLWIGFWGIGLGCLNETDGSFKYWLNNPDNPNSLSHNDVWVIYQDSKLRMWIGTNGGGLNLLEDKEKGLFRRWLFKENISSSLSSNSIYSICESTIKRTSSHSDETVLWIGTNNGLNRLVVNNSNSKNDFDATDVKISRFILKEGLVDNSIKSIVEDNEGNLWLGTSYGITKFDTKNYTFNNYSDADGIAGTDFNFSATTKNDDGILFMGSTSGLNYFHPQDIISSQFKPPVILTDFQVFNKSVPVSDESPIQTSIFHAKEIKLSYTQNVFSFQFAALDYASPQSIQYAYKMEGFDEDWIYSGNRRFVTYTNLNPGEYIFKVKSSNSDGIWNDNVSLIKVVISPPWWQTAWAIGFYVLILVLGAWGIIKFQVNRASLRLELKKREFESHHLREIESLKSRFFANLSHEFRTPLMLIKGPLEQMISGRIKNNLIDYYKMLLRNTEKLQQLIDELLELSQLETESIPLHKQQHDLVKLLKAIAGTFIPLAEEKNITLGFNSSVKSVIALIDKDKLEKIINNLLSNAFKFTPEGGKISLELAIDKQGKSDVATISISDTGIGIPEEHRSKIFDRFYQIDNVSKRNFGSSGIGLALVKELVSLQNWNISVFSKVQEGTVFTLRIPLEKEIEEIEEKNSGKLLFSSDTQEKNTNLLNFNGEDISDENNFSDKPVKPVILFIEDSSDVRNYVSELLSNDYEVFLANEAVEGMKLCLKQMPDLILSDIMMDGMDGIELCRRVKTDWQTSHIPVILLTAKATKESKIEGLVTGADDYITKPFIYEELSARIKNLIDQRKLLKEKFSKEINLTPGSIVSNDIDKGFMDKVINALENNLNNEKFDTELLAKEIFISRRQLHRKLQAVTGQAPGEFIRIFKLKRAAQMLIENKFSVTQIAFEIGFGSPAQFTRAFKKYFGCLPSEFKEKCSHQFFENN